MRNEQIVVCNGTSGETVTNLPADPALYELAWLSPLSFAYSTYDNFSLRRLEQKPDGDWVVRQIYDNITTNKVENLTAVSDQSVAWKEAGDVWTLNFDSGVIKKVWDSMTNQVQLVDFSYSKTAGEFLLNCYDARGQFLIRFSPATGTRRDAGRIGSEQDFVAIVKDINRQPWGWVAGWKRQGLVIVNPRWTDGGPEYAYESYLSEMGNWPALFVKPPSQTTPMRVPWNGFVENSALGTDRLFFTGAENGEMPGIWEFNFKAQTCRRLVGGSKPSGYAQISNSRTGLVTNESGMVKTYFLWPPVKVVDGKKYPVVITKQFWNWCPYNQLAANEGYYFAVVDEVCEVAFARMFVKNPGIDARRVYLYESSGGTLFADELMAEYPDLWKGAVLFGAYGGPALSDLKGKRLLIVDGTEDGNGDAVKSLTKYQEAAIQAGVPVTIAFVKDSGHMPNSIASERARAGHFAEFLSTR